MSENARLENVAPEIQRWKMRDLKMQEQKK